MRNVYLELKKRDLITMFKPLFERGYHLAPNGKITRVRRPSWDTPWLFVHDSDRDCNLLHFVIWDHLKFVPSRCHACWKVVIEPRNVVQLFRLREIQVALNEHGKCGIEGIRANSAKLYGGYWYNDSREEGLRRYEQVREIIEQDDVFNRDLPDPWRFDAAKHLILKRACTEFEQELGDSSKWKIGDEQLDLEHRIYEAFEVDQNSYPQPRHVQAHIKCNWIHKAFQWGDPTYKTFTGGEDLFRPLRTYHGGKDKKAKRPDRKKG